MIHVDIMQIFSGMSHFFNSVSLAKATMADIGGEGAGLAGF